MTGLLAWAFFTGTVQVFLVAFQQRQIAFRAPLFNIVSVGVLISTVWVWNVRAATGGFWMGFWYVVGAGLGTFLAMLIRVNGRGSIPQEKV